MKNYDCKQCKVAADRSIFLTKLFKKLGSRGKEQTAEAAYVSRRLASARFPTADSTWDHWVTFSLEDGNTLELLAPKEVFNSLQDGLSGILTWSGDALLRFDPKE